MQNDASLREKSGVSPELRFPECFNQTEIDPRTKRRTVPMEVICIGMMRTGTMSIKVALEKLGYDHVYHMNSVIKNPKDSEMWLQAFEAKYHGKGTPLTRKDWDQLLGDSRACIDLPTAAFMPELIAAYPEAKVLISQRDPDKWYESVYNTIVKERLKSRSTQFIVPFDSFFYRRWFAMMVSMTAMWGPRGLNDKQRCIEVYNDIHDDVRSMVPKERRLEYKLGMGWEPLCKFLDKPVPREPFPFINESNSFRDRARLMRNQAYIRVAKQIIPWILTVWAFAAVLYLLRRL